MDVSKNTGTPKWMVYNGKPLLKWMIWRVPLYLETPKLTCAYCSNGLTNLAFFLAPQKLQGWTFNGGPWKS